MPPLDLAEEILLEIRAINRRLDQLEHRVPVADRTWLSPGEMSKLCGVTPRTLQTYVDTGRISRASYKREPKGKTFNYKYHRELVLHDLGIK